MVRFPPTSFPRWWSGWLHTKNGHIMPTHIWEQYGMTKPLHCMAWYIWYHANSRAQSFHSLHTSLSLDRGEKEVSNNLGVIVWDFLQRSCVLLSLIITGDFKILLVRPKFSIGSPKSIDLYGSIRDISCTARVIWVTRLSFLATALFWNPPIIAWHLRPHGTHCKLCEFLFKPRKVTPPIFWKVCRSGKLSSKSWEKLPLLLRVLIYLHKYRTTAFFPQWHLDWGIC